MSNKNRSRIGWTRYAAVLSVFLSVAGIGMAAASGPSAAVSTGSGAPQQWAYGAETWYNTTSLTSTYSLHEVVFYGSQVVTTATNTSSSTVELQADSATAFSESYVYCEPNCTTPSTSYYNLSLDEWSSTTSFVNVTSAAAVYENTSGHGLTSVPAYGISNATWISQANYSEQYEYLLHGAPYYNGSDYSQTNSTFRVDFSPAIGLIPWNLSTHLGWSASSNATAFYRAPSTYHVTYNGLDNYTIFEYGSTFTLWNIPESEAVMGEDLGNTTLANGANATVIKLGFSGPLDVADGIFASPVSQDLFGGATGNWSVGVVAGALAHTTALSVVSAGPAYHIVASTTAWSAPIRMIGLRAGSYTVLPDPINTPVAGNAQAQPEAVGYAQARASCLVGACGTSAPRSLLPTGGSSWALPSWTVAPIVGGGAALVALLVLIRRRRAKGTSESPVARSPPAGHEPPSSP